MEERTITKAGVPPPVNQEPPLASVATPNDAVAPPPHGTTTTPQAPTLFTPQETDISSKKVAKGSLDRDIALSQLENDKRSSFIKAREDSKKSKVDNKAQKKLSEVATWEKTQRTKLEAKTEESSSKIFSRVSDHGYAFLEDPTQYQLEHKIDEYAEKIKNEVALICKEADEKRAVVDARKGEELLKAEETAAKYRATGQTPKKQLLGCCGR
ncbi:remorin [Capsicum annuum]|uniref:remorin n=1 Tax=Capsicum annuum TaxID=4072 RepID=UPI0007BEFC5A|nr:remorin [Capsicum annuum]